MPSIKTNTHGNQKLSDSDILDIQSERNELDIKISLLKRKKDLTLTKRGITYNWFRKRLRDITS